MIDEIIIPYAKLPDILTEQNHLYSLCGHLANRWAGDREPLGTVKLLSNTRFDR